MNVVDSSAWLAYFAGTKNARHFAPAIETPAKLIVPSLSIYEVFKRVLSQRGESEALTVLGVMSACRVVDLDAVLATDAARISIEERLPMADSIILATARAHSATLWTQDADFKGKEGVKYFEG